MASQALSILVYHRVRPARDPLFPDELDAARFDRQLRLLAGWFHVMPLCDAVHALRHDNLPARAACITFDDGYADNVEVALPLLLRHRLPATFFIAAGYLNGGQMWNDVVIDMVRRASGDVLNLSRQGLGRFDIRTPALRRLAVAQLLAALKHLPGAERSSRLRALQQPHTPMMMHADQLLALHRAGMEIGAHTVTHPILSAVPVQEARQEIIEGRQQLEAVIDAPVRVFAYPNGKPGCDFTDVHVRLVRQVGFDAAVTTRWGAALRGSDPFQLPRFTPWDHGSGRFGLRLMWNRLRSQP